MSCVTCNESFGAKGENMAMQLSCGHSFCRKCCTVSNTTTNSGLRCIICHGITTTKVRTENNSDVFGTVNIALNSYVTCTTIPICCECETNAAVLHCSSCQASLCSECSSQVHRLKILQNHNPKRISPGRVINSNSCLEHHQDIVRYCCECQKGICLTCMDEHCKSHSRATFAALAQQQSQSLAEKLNKLKTELPRISTLTKATAAAVKDVQQNEKKALSDVNQLIEDLKARLDRRGNELLKQITQVTANKVGRLSYQEQQLTLLSDVMTKLSTEGSETIQHFTAHQQPQTQTHFHDMIAQDCAQLKQFIESALSQWAAITKSIDSDVDDAARFIGDPAIRINFASAIISDQNKSSLLDQISLLESQINELGQVVELDYDQLELSRGLEWQQHKSDIRMITLRWKDNNLKSSSESPQQVFEMTCNHLGIHAKGNVGDISIEKYVVSYHEVHNQQPSDIATSVDLISQVDIVPQTGNCDEQGVWSYTITNLKDLMDYQFTVTAQYRYLHSAQSNTRVQVITPPLTCTTPISVKFVKTSNDSVVKLSNNGTTLTHTGEDSVWHFGVSDVLTVNVFSWKLVLQQLPKQNYFMCGIIAIDTPKANAYYDESFFGWCGYSGSSFTFSKGKYNSSSPISGWDGFTQGDQVLLKLDMTRSTLTLTHPRSNTTHTITDLPKFDWRVCAHTYHNQTVVGLY
eukprot:c2389_g1_i1.p1 GENE.c2389_g1_i1~~c2389_g1_i1.p1  ORF type:complete len:692 (+),score=129.15 c2389_g1_i1:3-2078(+)